MIRHSSRLLLKRLSNFTKFTGILLALVFLESCEGYRCADGTVIDKITNLPLDSVLVKVITGTEIVYTDTTGKFDVCNKFGGCVPDCKDIMVEFSKDNYTTIILKNPDKEVIVIMEK